MEDDTKARDNTSQRTEILIFHGLTTLRFTYLCGACGVHGVIGDVLLLPPSAPERSRLVSTRSFSTSERFASRSLTPDEISPSALTLFRPKRATKRRMATPTCLLFCAAFGGSAEF